MEWNGRGEHDGDYGLVVVNDVAVVWIDLYFSAADPKGNPINRSTPNSYCLT